MLDIRELHVHYGSVKAVRGVSIQIGAGELVGLVGPNGAGKSSILNAIAGAIRSESGRVQYAGQEITNRAPENIARLGISLVPEGRRIFGTLTVAENLRMGQSKFGRRTNFAQESQRILEIFPVLKAHLSSPAARLSGGQQQQLAVGRALLTRPKLMLLDEPSLGLDPLATDSIFESIERLRADGISILLVEQNALRTIGLADRTYVLKGGRIAHAGEGDRAQATEYLDSTYFGHSQEREQ